MGTAARGLRRTRRLRRSRAQAKLAVDPESESPLDRLGTAGSGSDRGCLKEPRPSRRARCFGKRQISSVDIPEMGMAKVADFTTPLRVLHQSSRGGGHGTLTHRPGALTLS